MQFPTWFLPWFRRRAPHLSGIRGQGNARVSVCFLGDGVSGSWQMRARQIAAMRPHWTAKAAKELTALDVQRHQVFCIVKRFDRAVAERLRAEGKAVVYDVVDPWRQPEDGERHPTLDMVIGYFTKVLRDLPVDGVIFPNDTMRHDLGHLVPRPVTIYHHHKPELRPIAVKRRAEVVGYEGVAEYLGPWRDVVESVCMRRGLRFVINPASLAHIDIGFAARGGRHGSLMASRYKSNVKLANFFAAGIPCVVHADEMSYRETDNGQVRFVRDRAELEAAVEQLLPYETRQAIHGSFVSHSARFRLPRIVAQYEAYFSQLVATASDVVVRAAS